MSDRERWFRVVMGQEEVAKLINKSSLETIPLPESVSDSLNYNLSLSTSMASKLTRTISEGSLEEE
jgi:hypothetical protein